MAMLGTLTTPTPGEKCSFVIRCTKLPLQIYEVELKIRQYLVFFTITVRLLIILCDLFTFELI